MTTHEEDALFPLPDDGGNAAVLLQVAQLERRVQDLETLLLDEPDLAGYQPVPAPRWWQLTGQARDDALTRLADWVESVYVPSYGRLAAQLPVCWRDHNLALFVLDFMCELHGVLYLRLRRSAATLNSQAEYHLRLLPAAVEMIKDDAPGTHPHGRGAR